MKLRELIEARSHSEQNPRIMVRDYIEQRYHDTEQKSNHIAGLVNLFVSFGEIEKLGIHPQAPNTLDELPVGIYAYPAELILRQTTHKWLYAGMNPWVNVFELRGRAINFDTITRGQQERLIRQASDIITSSAEFLDLDDQYWLNNELVFNNVGEWWSLLLGMAAKFKKQLGTNNSQVAANKLHRLLGIDAVIDPGNYLISDDIEGQAVIFRSSSITANHRLPNIYNHPYKWSQPNTLDTTFKDLLDRIIFHLQHGSAKQGLGQSSQLTRAINDVVAFLQHELESRMIIDIETPSQWAASIFKHVNTLPSVRGLSGQDAGDFWSLLRLAVNSARDFYA